MTELKLKPSGLAQALDTAYRADVVPIVLGSPGIGKSHIIAASAERAGMRLVDERASTMDLTDWRGVPDIDRERGTTTWRPPDFLPGPDDPETLLFFDEITQAPPQCQPPLYQLLLEGRMGTVWQRPEGTRFAAAGNLAEDGTFAQRIGSALRDRMVLLHLIPDLDEWCAWAYAHKIPPVIVAFLRFRPNLLYAHDPDVWASPTLRGWEMAGRILDASGSNGNARNALLEGKVGYPAVVEFLAFERTWNSIPDVDAALRNPGAFERPEDPCLRYAMAAAVAQRATSANFRAVRELLGRMGNEYAVFGIRSAVAKTPALKAHPEYTRWLLAEYRVEW